MLLALIFAIAVLASGPSIADELDDALERLRPTTMPLGDFPGVYFNPLKTIPAEHIHADIKTGRVTIRGPLDEKEVRESLSKHEKWLRYCYEVTALDHPDITAGKTVFNVIVEPTGFVSRDEDILYKSNIKDYVFENCITSSPPEWRFPTAPRKSSVTVTTHFAPTKKRVLDADTHIVPERDSLFQSGRFDSENATGELVLSASGFNNADMVLQVARTKIVAAQYCFEKERVQQKTLLNVYIAVGSRTTTISKIEFVRGDASVELKACLKRMISRWAFPPSSKTDSGHLVLRFTPNE